MDFSRELLLRGMASGTFVALAAIIALPLLSPARMAGCLFSLAVAAHTITQLPDWQALLGPFTIPVWVLSVAAPGLFWSFVLTLFDDRDHSLRNLGTPSIVLVLIGSAAALVPAISGAAWSLHNVFAAVLFGHAALLVWRGWQSDLVEARRRLRGGILVAAALYGIVVVVVQLWELAYGPADAASPLAAIALCLFAIAALVVFSRPDGDLFEPAFAQTGRTSEEPADAAAENLANRLETLMRVERAYREENLGIGGVASRLGVPEYRLRKLINGRLSYRNFASYLNYWRLEEAKFALRDPSQREVPISTIALDCGYGSLGPFNRAFKSDTGMTPTAYRAASAR